MDLLEREDVLQDLLGHLTKAGAGQGRLVLLAGEAGIGKSAVIHRLGQLARPGARVLIGACDPLSTPSPLAPLLDIATQISPPLRQALTATLPTQQHRATTLFHHLLSELAAARPTLLIVEDIHWADEATLDLLRYLARRIATTPALVVATYRDDELTRTHPMTILLGDLAAHRAVHRHRLAPLSRQATARLATGRRIDVERLQRITGGNPFFVTEILAAPGVELPATVRQAVLGRLARLPEATWALMEAMAVIGSPAALELVTAVVPGVHAAIVEARARNIVHTEAHTIAFRHELVRLTVYEAIPAAGRVGWHQRVLAALQTRAISAENLARLAFHAEAAQADDTMVLTYAQAAAQYDRVLRHALEAPDHRRSILLEQQAYQCYLSGQIPQAIESWQQALDLRRGLEHWLRAGDDLRWISHMFWTAGHLNKAIRIAEQALQILTGLEPSRQLAWAYLNRSRLALWARDDDASTDYAHKALALAQRFGDIRLDILARLHLAATPVMHTSQGWAHLEEVLAEAIAADLDEAAAFTWAILCWLAALHRDLARAKAAFEQAQAYCLDRDLTAYLPFLRGPAALMMLHRGRWDAATDAASAVMNHPNAPRTSRIMPLVVLALIRARRGDPDTWPLLEEALKLVGHQDLRQLGPVSQARAEAAWLTGDDARTITEASSVALGTAGDAWLTGELACWIRRAGGTPPPVPAAEPFARELAGDWRAAAAAWEQAGCPYDAALARLDGDTEALNQALATFEALGARPAAERTRAQLRALGIRPVSRGPRAASRANPHGLTNREAQILSLLGEGLSDAQIADRLVLSRKTVNHHVSAILAKLEVRTRHEAVRKLAT